MKLITTLSKAVAKIAVLSSYVTEPKVENTSAYDLGRQSRPKHFEPCPAQPKPGGFWPTHAICRVECGQRKLNLKKIELVRSCVFSFFYSSPEDRLLT